MKRREPDELDDSAAPDTDESPGMSDGEVCQAVDMLSKQCIGVEDENSDADEAYDYYHGRAVGLLSPPTIPGRSHVVSRDVMEVVEWAVPVLVEIFASTDDIIKFNATSGEDQQAALDITNYIGYLIHRANSDGFTTLHDAIKQCLIAQISGGKCYVEQVQEEREEDYHGLTAEEVDLLMQDEEIELVSQEEDGTTGMAPAMSMGMPAPGPGLPEPTYTCTFKRVQYAYEYRNVGVPLEELRIHRDTRSLEDCRFIEHRRLVTVSYLREEGYDEELIDALSLDDDDTHQSNRDARDEDENTNQGDKDQAPDDSQKQVMLSESYCKLDIDGTGETQYWKIVKADNTLLEKEKTDDHPFWAFSPILMPYQLKGLSLENLVKDLQEINTALLRGGLDNTYLANNPLREVVTKNLYDIDEVISPRVGGMYQVTAAGSVNTVETPDRIQPTIAMLQEMRQMRDSRSGVTEMNSAMSPESLSQTNVGSQGIAGLMNAGASRMKLISRVLAETGFKRMYYLMLKNVKQYQNKRHEYEVNGRWLQVDPREWKNKFKLSVSVGTGTFGRAETVMNLRTVGGMQKELVALGMIKPIQIYNTAKRAIEAMGFRDTSQFITEPPPDAQMPPPQGQPGAAAVPDLVGAEKVKGEFALKKAEMDNQTKLQLGREQIQAEKEVAMFKAKAELQQMAAKTMLTPPPAAPRAPFATH